jgi:hypothetical protein
MFLSGYLRIPIIFLLVFLSSFFFAVLCAIFFSGEDVLKVPCMLRTFLLVVNVVIGGLLPAFDGTQSRPAI